MEQRIHVLLIEDDPESELILSLRLNEACGADLRFTLESASTLEVGLRRLKAGDFSLVILDLVLPDSRGLETVVRAKAACGDVPIVVTTWLADEKLALEAVASGAQDFLLKDRLEARGLRRALSYALQRSQARRIEQIEAEIAERRRVEAIKDQVMSTIAHELRSPLFVTKAAIANVAEGLAGELTEDQRQLLKVAGRNLERLARVLDNFLGLSRLESGRAKVEPRKVDAFLLLGEALEGERIADRDRRLEWTLTLPAGLPPVCVDPDLFRELVENLLDNAARFARSRVLVSAEAKGAEVVVSVEDDGPGIPPEQAGKLFQRFVQLERRASAGYKGTGLGLAICREIARVSRGRIWLEAGRPSGTRFLFSVPIWQAAGRPVTSADTL